MELSRILEELEQDLTTVYLTERADRLRQAHKEAQVMGEAKLAEELGWEVQVFDLRTPYPAFPRDTQAWFLPLIEWSDGTKYPQIEKLIADDAAIAYYRTRVEETVNHIHKARYCDFLWEALQQRKEPDAHRYARQAIDAYLECVPIYVTHEGYLELADALARAVELIIRLNDQALAQRVTEAILTTLQGLPDEERARWVLDLGRALLALRATRLGATVTDDNLRTLLEFYVAGGAVFEKRGNFHLQRECLRSAAAVSQSLSDMAGALQWQFRVAQSFEAEGRARAEIKGPTGGSLVAAHFYEQAVHQYLWILSAGPDEAMRQQIRVEIERLKADIRQALRAAEQEMQSVSVEFELPAAELEPLIEDLAALEGDKAFRALAASEWLLPDIKRMRQHAEQVSQKYVFSQLFPTKVIREGTKVREYGLEDKASEQLSMEMGVFAQIQVVTLDYIFFKLKEAGLLTQENLVSYLRQWELMDESDLELIEAGVERYFADDHVSAVHILAPRIENILKGMFEKTGVASLRDPERDRMLEEGLDKFLRRPEVERALGERVWYYLHFALIDPAGLNLRNDVAHGWISKARCNRHTSQVLLYILILLTRFGISPVREEASEDVACSGETA